MQNAYGLPAPAKLNLFLHITGRRPDGYHLLQSAFVLVSLADSIDIEVTDDGLITREGDVIGDVQGDLCVRAAQMLKRLTGSPLGARIRVTKRIPAGAGLGGGSSDAATTLIALNRLWDINWPVSMLARFAVQLGADVPFFVHGRNAFVEGIGEKITPVDVRAASYALVWPGTGVSTKGIYTAPDLPRDCAPVSIDDFLAADPQSSFGCNVMQQVACRLEPAVSQALDFLQTSGHARMTGSGSACFVEVQSPVAARGVLAGTPAHWSAFAVETLPEHPLCGWHASKP